MQDRLSEEEYAILARALGWASRRGASILDSPEDNPMGELGSPPEPSMLRNALENQIGNSVVLTPGISRPLIQARGASSRGGVITVDLGIQSVEESAVGGNLHRGAVLAKISWGQGSASFEAFVDVRTGTQISVCASSLNAEVSIQEPGVPQTIQRAQVSAAFGEVQRPSRSEPTVTFAPLVVIPQSGIIVPVPPFARTFWLFTAQRAPIDFYAAGNIRVIFLGGSDTADFPFFEVGGPELLLASATEGVRWPDGARFVRIFNNQPIAGATLIATPTFGLSL